MRGNVQQKKAETPNQTVTERGALYSWGKLYIWPGQSFVIFGGVS